MNAAAEMAYHLKIVEGLADRVLQQNPVLKNPMEDRYTEILQEKKEAIHNTLSELKQEPSMTEELHKNLSVIYRADETDKLLFEQWKRVSSQNNWVNQEELEELEKDMQRMKTELEEVVPFIEEMAGGWEKMRFVVPALYREQARKGE
ncbi:hypothetical protein [Sediminibacillus massiliensis]|uniref:hypothetical protein n=1 Tax=Sediminibacillus massiliensis TaxID=1926277 RepID=UPI000988487A|nr:hypothetical protein [Sediminibacillus massiliensis]